MRKTSRKIEGVSQPKILLAGDGPVPTGFARVIEGIFFPLIDAFEIHHLAISYSGDPHHLPWTVYPAGINGADYSGQHRIAELTRKIEPDAIFMINDIWIVFKWLGALSEIDNSPPIIAYIPIDAGPVNSKWIVNYDRLDQICVYTQYAKTQLLRAFDEHRELNPKFSPPPIEVVPHGVDTETFRPISDHCRRAARSRIFPENPELLDAFIVLNANRNQPRKRIDLTIKGFSLFAKNKPENVKLFLHMGARDVGWDIPALAKRYDIEGRLLMSTSEAQMPFVSSEHLNLVYNACDVGINTSEAEGWGLVNHEHAATRASQIVPNHTAYTDLWGKAVVKLEPLLSGIDPTTSTETHYIAPQDLAKALESLYSDPKLLRLMADRAFNWATHQDFQWSTLSGQWRQIIHTSIAQRETKIT